MSNLTENKITLTVKQLEQLLEKQKVVTGEYITRNLSVYHWFDPDKQLDIQKAKSELMEGCLRSGFPDDFYVLKKYLQ